MGSKLLRRGANRNERGTGRASKLVTYGPQTTAVWMDGIGNKRAELYTINLRTKIPGYGEKRGARKSKLGREMGRVNKLVTLESSVGLKMCFILEGTGKRGVGNSQIQMKLDEMGNARGFARAKQSKPVTLEPEVNERYKVLLVLGG